jgi:hypothetical protein
MIAIQLHDEGVLNLTVMSADAQTLAFSTCRTKPKYHITHAGMLVCTCSVQPSCHHVQLHQMPTGKEPVTNTEPSVRTHNSPRWPTDRSGWYCSIIGYISTTAQQHTSAATLRHKPHSIPCTNAIFTYASPAFTANQHGVSTPKWERAVPPAVLRQGGCAAHPGHIPAVKPHRHPPKKTGGNIAT